MATKYWADAEANAAYAVANQKTAITSIVLPCAAYMNTLPINKMRLDAQTIPNPYVLAANT